MVEADLLGGNDIVPDQRSCSCCREARSQGLHCIVSFVSCIAYTKGVSLLNPSCQQSLRHFHNAFCLASWGTAGNSRTKGEIDKIKSIDNTPSKSGRKTGKV